MYISNIKLINEFINNGGHINAWTDEKFSSFLSKVGIKSNRTDYGKSLSKVLGSLDHQKDRSKISICHEGWVEKI